MARRDRIREELGWLKMVVALAATATASVVAWMVTSGVLRANVLLFMLAWAVSLIGTGATTGLVWQLYRLLNELEREE